MKSTQRHFGFVVCILLAALIALPARAHDGSHASVHDTVAAIIQRMQRVLTDDQLIELTGRTWSHS